MTALPEFHTAAVKAARERIEHARAEVAEAQKVADEIDRLLATLKRAA